MPLDGSPSAKQHTGKRSRKPKISQTHTIVTRLHVTMFDLFTLFSDLPTEIRLSITLRQIHPKCHEAREELRRIYNKRIFDFNIPQLPTSPYIWFNPYCDVVLLNRAMRRLARKAFFDGTDFPIFNLAIEDRKHFSDHDLILPEVHAFSPPDPHAAQVKNSLSLRHQLGIRSLYILIGSIYWDERLIRESIQQFRPAPHKGLHRETVQDVVALHSDYNRGRMEADPTRNAYPKWADGNAPLNIIEVSLVPITTVGYGSGIYEFLPISKSVADTINYPGYAGLLEWIEKKSNCFVSLSTMWPCYLVGEIVFHGTAKEIAACKALLTDTFGDLGGDGKDMQGKRYTVPDESEAEDGDDLNDLTYPQRPAKKVRVAKEG